MLTYDRLNFILVSVYFWQRYSNTNKRYYDLILKFKEKTGCPVIVNTSFNVRGEPIVNTPSDAFNCFMGTELDYLVI